MAKSNIPGSQALSINVSESLYNALQKRCIGTGETIDHLVQDSLAKALGLEHHTLYQVSTSTALVQGVYQGCVTVGTVKEHGNFGLGTYDALNGEGLMLDGHVYQALPDGSVIEPLDSATAPFWVSAQFEADRRAIIDSVSDWAGLCTHIDNLRCSDNLFAAIRIDGTFDEIYYRVACKSAPGTDLVTATSHQADFKFSNIPGTLLGFWSPSYVSTLNIPGYHLHFLSADHQHGGHVLGIQAKNLKLQVMDSDNLVIALPETPGFLKADLSGNPAAALSKIEHAQKN
jgi:acetolactate decarboxylase